MDRRHSWMRKGATWEEVMTDHFEHPPEKTRIIYRVIGGTAADPEIERRERCGGEEDISSITKEDMVYEGLLLDREPEIYEMIEINDESFVLVGTEDIRLNNIHREAFRFIRKQRMECERCGGDGECGECSGTGECMECDDTGKCQDCEGDRQCMECEGTGRCQYCDGTGRDGAEPCDECHGTGKCPTCDGSRRCAACQGTGKCPACDGTRRCGFCKGSGKCRDCQGHGTAMVVHQNWFDTSSGLLLRSLRTSFKQKLHERVLVSFRFPR